MRWQVSTYQFPKVEPQVWVLTGGASNRESTDLDRLSRWSRLKIPTLINYSAWPKKSNKHQFKSTKMKHHGLLKRRATLRIPRMMRFLICPKRPMLSSMKTIPSCEDVHSTLRKVSVNPLILVSTCFFSATSSNWSRSSFSSSSSLIFKVASTLVNAVKNTILQSWVPSFFWILGRSHRTQWMS